MTQGKQHNRHETLGTLGNSVHDDVNLSVDMGIYVLATCKPDLAGVSQID